MSDSTTLWAIHVEGPDSVIAQPDKETANRRAADFNSWYENRHDKSPYDPVCRFVVIKYPYGYELWRAEIDEHGGNPEDWA